MTYHELQSAIAKKEFAPVYLLCGEEDFLIDECVQSIIEHALDSSTKEFNLDIVYGSQMEAKDVVARASSFAMLGERRVVVVREFEKLLDSESAKEIITAYILKPLKSNCLVLIAAKPDFRKRPYTDLKKIATLVECPPLYDNEVPAWIAQRVHQLGKEITPEACQVLQGYVGNSLRAIQNEIDKLFIFVDEKKQITGEDVSAVVGLSKGFTVFELQNAIGRKDIAEAISILERMLGLGESPQFIIVMLTRFFNQLWKLSDLKRRSASEYEISAELRIRPFFVKQYLEFSSNFPLEHIEQNFRALLEADMTLKTTSRDPRLVLDLLLYSLIKGTLETEQVSL